MLSYIVILAIAFVGLNALDAALTVAGMSKGGVAELNPIMCPLLEQSEWVFWVFKIGMASIFYLFKFFQSLSTSFKCVLVAFL
jgi:hypothetical protein